MIVGIVGASSHEADQNVRCYEEERNPKQTVDERATISHFLTNASDEESDFMIENHCEHSAFKIEPKFGNAAPRETTELKIEFRQEKTGMNKCILPILFSKQASYRTCELFDRY
ncbi:unnamed protein product [Trichogramma brassicae]|uniref:Uncharacterized protein n=1 Tax=Trichogramma brassicae TaxID=86971 RepID=A0A6H5IY67_9HYME|nr:unnamed protein product [Trichogramma brassicae]